MRASLPSALAAAVLALAVQLPATMSAGLGRSGPRNVRERRLAARMGTASRKARQACHDTAGAFLDADNLGCSSYDDEPAYCGNYDDYDFSSRALCCACGGGDSGDDGSSDTSDCWEVAQASDCRALVGCVWANYCAEPSCYNMGGNQSACEAYDGGSSSPRGCVWMGGGSDGTDAFTPYCDSWSLSSAPSTAEPTTAEPTTAEPTVAVPTPSPSPAPTDAPTAAPTTLPSVFPTRAPHSGIPTLAPTPAPSAAPATTEPSPVPTSAPTAAPNTPAPSPAPSPSPSVPAPTLTPSGSAPTHTPSVTRPTRSPTGSRPTRSPVSHKPTDSPTTPMPTMLDPTAAPSAVPSTAPTGARRFIEFTISTGSHFRDMSPGAVAQLRGAVAAAIRGRFEVSAEDIIAVDITANPAAEVAGSGIVGRVSLRATDAGVAAGLAAEAMTSAEPLIITNADRTYVVASAMVWHAVITGSPTASPTTFGSRNGGSTAADDDTELVTGLVIGGIFLMVLLLFAVLVMMVRSPTAAFGKGMEQRYTSAMMNQHYYPKQSMAGTPASPGRPSQVAQVQG